MEDQKLFFSVVSVALIIDLITTTGCSNSAHVHVDEEKMVLHQETPGTKYFILLKHLWSQISVRLLSTDKTFR